MESASSVEQNKVVLLFWNAQIHYRVS